jgi:hypothetical protein
MLVKFAFNLGRVWQYFQGRKFAIISAYLSQFKPQVNEERARALKKAVRDLGYGYHEIEGTWQDPKTGNVALEYPLFIPDISYADAISLGQGVFMGGPPQDSIVWADEQGIYLVKTIENPPRIDRKFTKLLANQPSEKVLRERYDHAQPAVEKQKAGLPLTPEEEKAVELSDAWTNYSKVPKGSRPWAYGSVTWTMGEPPTSERTGWLSGQAEAAWRDSKREHPFAFRYRADQVASSILMYQGALYREAQYVPHPLPKQVVALLRKRFRSPTFSNELNIPQKNAKNWDIDPGNVLDSTVMYSTGSLATRFSWHPVSGEFLLSAPAEMHAITIRNYGTHSFDEYVRGLVLRDQKVIATRPWAPDVDFGMMTGDPDEDRAQQYLMEQASAESQEACQRVLTSVGGVPGNWKWKFDISNANLQDMTGIFRW